MPHAPQHPDNPCGTTLPEVEQVPAKIWELLRRNERFHRAVSRLQLLDAAARSESPFGKHWYVARELVKALKKHHALAGLALEWLVPEPWFQIQYVVATPEFASTGKATIPGKVIKIEGGSKPDPADKTHWRVDLADGEFDAHGIRTIAGGAPKVRGPVITYTVAEDSRLSNDPFNAIQEWHDYQTSHGPFTLNDTWQNAPPGFKREFCNLWRYADGFALNPHTQSLDYFNQWGGTAFFEGWDLLEIHDQLKVHHFAKKLEFDRLKDCHVFAVPKRFTTRDDRLDTVAQDIVRHFLGRGFVGKAMVVSIDKATALKMHDKVRKHWEAEMRRVRLELGRFGLTAEQKDELLDRLRVLDTTDMALIVSPGQNEIEQMRKHGLDIVRHRQRMNESQPPLDEKFKDTDDPLRLVFVCAMWLTGFDAPSCSTVYLDKPMRNHTLMQTIARANRVFPGKHSGMIVDYANVFASLEKALAIYGAGKGGKNPVKDKQKLVADLRKAVDAATTFCATRQVILPAIEQLVAGSLERLARVDDAVNALISPDPLRREFLGHERLVNTLYGAVKPDPAALEFAGRVACLTAIADAIRVKLNPDPADITGVMGDIAKLLDASITGVDMPAKPVPVMDLSKIDFEALHSRFKESKHKNTDLEVLKATIRAMLERLVRLNKTRADFGEKFEELIESYNAGSRNIEELFEELLKLSRNLSDEQQRHIRENMTEEELVIFDILTRPAPELSAEERAEVKKVARDLLNRLKQLLVLNWRQKSSARSQLKLTIEDVLDTGLPRAYDKPLYAQKCSALFEHIFESYPERDASVYAAAS